MSRALIAAVLLALLASPISLRAQQPAPKTGSFETTFSTRSPLSDMKTLTKRLGVTADTTDYDLKSQPFLVYIPEKYDPQKPPGLLALVNYKRSDSLPRPVLPQLAAVNMAFVVAKEFPESWPQRAGLALDAVFNLHQQYHLDPNRIYILSGAEPPDTTGVPPQVALRLGLNYPEVFTGTISFGVLSYRPVQASARAFYRPEMPRPDLKSFELAKLRPLVIATPEPADQWDRYTAAFKADGFKHVKSMTLTLQQYHYPNYTTDWLPDTLKFLDAATADLKPPATRPATRSAP